MNFFALKNKTKRKQKKYKGFLATDYPPCLRICSSVCTSAHFLRGQSSSVGIPHTTMNNGLKRTLQDYTCQITIYFTGCNSLNIKHCTSRQLIIPLLFKEFRQKLATPRDNLLVNSLANFHKFSKGFHGHGQLFYNLQP